MRSGSRSFKRSAAALFLLLAVLLIPVACVYKSDAPLLVALDGEDTPLLLIKNARLFSATPGDRVREGMQILIRDGIVADISAEQLSAPGARVIDAAGRTVAPGLVDAHVHITSPTAPPWLLSQPTVERNLAAFLYAGVTTVLDQGSFTGETVDWVARIKSGEALGPRAHHSGRPFAEKDGHPSTLIRLFIPWPLSSFMISRSFYELTDESAAQIAAMVGENKTAGASHTKVYFDEIPLEVPVLTRKKVEGIIAAAREQGLPPMVHIGREEHVKLALGAGADIFVHSPYRSKLSDETIRLMAERKATVAATALVFDRAVAMVKGKLKLDEFDRVILDDREEAAYRNQPDDYGSEEEFRPWIDETERFTALNYRNIERMHRAGVIILAATDTPNAGSLPGATMHQELNALVERSGFSALEALLAATYYPGQLVERIGGLKGTGQVRVGGPADLLIVDGRPDRDIAALRRIDTILLGGRVLKRTEELK